MATGAPNAQTNDIAEGTITMTVLNQAGQVAERKVTEVNSGGAYVVAHEVSSDPDEFFRYRTTTYLGSGFEHHTEYAQLNGSGKTENCSLHVMDDQNRIAIVRVGQAFPDDGAAPHPVQYHHGDHLGSSSVVISDNGTWINREEFFPPGRGAE